jgi:small subunit ribosomal protein S27Ae
MMPNGSPNSQAKHTKYVIEGDSLTRKGEFCPVCGPGVFLGIHSDRKVCGKCGLSDPPKAHRGIYQEEE